MAYMTNFHQFDEWIPDNLSLRSYRQGGGEDKALERRGTPLVRARSRMRTLNWKYVAVAFIAVLAAVLLYLPLEEDARAA